MPPTPAKGKKERGVALDSVPATASPGAIFTPRPAIFVAGEMRGFFFSELPLAHRLFATPAPEAAGRRRGLLDWTAGILVDPHSRPPKTSSGGGKNCHFSASNFVRLGAAAGNRVWQVGP